MAAVAVCGVRGLLLAGLLVAEACGAVPANRAPQFPSADDGLPWKNVRAFGAMADGRDDTAAFLAAMKTGGRVYIPTGTYRVNLDLAQIPDPSGLILVGDGYGNGSNGTVLRGFDEARPVIRGEFPSSRIVRKLGFRDLVISQTGGGEAPDNDGIRFRSVYEVVYENVYFVNLGGWCVNLDASVGHSFYNCQCYKGNPRRGLGGLRVTSQSNLVNVFGGRFSGSGPEDRQPAFRVEGPIGGIRLVGCSIESWGNGVLLDNGAGKVVDVSIDAHFEENNVSDVRVGTMAGGAGNPVIGVNVRGTFAGPVLKSGYALELWGRSVRSLSFGNAYVTNRAAVVDLSDETVPEGVVIGPLYHDGLPLLRGRARAGISFAEVTQGGSW